MILWAGDVDIEGFVLHTEYNFRDFHRIIGMKPCEVNTFNGTEVLRRIFSNEKQKKKI